eukprot:scaffold129041_cov57-Phaeocystis_antarctica.AAC.3
MENFAASPLLLVATGSVGLPPLDSRGQRTSAPRRQTAALFARHGGRARGKPHHSYTPEPSLHRPTGTGRGVSRCPRSGAAHLPVPDPNLPEPPPGGGDGWRAIFVERVALQPPRGHADGRAAGLHVHSAEGDREPAAAAV